MSEDSSKIKIQGHFPQLNWNPLWAIVVVLFAFLIIPTVAGLILYLTPTLVLQWNSVRADEWLLNSPVATFISVVLTYGMALAALWWFVSYKKYSLWKATGAVRPRWLDIVYAVLAWLAYMGIYLVVLMLLQQVFSIDTEKEQALGFDKEVSGSALTMAFVSLVVLPPVVEELFFRGFLYGTLRSVRLPMIMSVVITSVLFAVLHLFGSVDGSLLWIAFIDTFVLSVVLCYVRERTGTIWACMGIHALKNGLTFLYLFILAA